MQNPDNGVSADLMESLCHGEADDHEMKLGVGNDGIAWADRLVCLSDCLSVCLSIGLSVCLTLT